MARFQDIAQDLSRSVGGDAERVKGLREIVASMGTEPPDREAPAREIPARLGDRWSALLLLVLRTGTYRHAELKRVVSLLAHEESISQRMLTLRLRTLERDGLVERSVMPTVPPRVDYALTPLGQELTQRFFSLVRWIEDRDAEIQAARERFDSN